MLGNTLQDVYHNCVEIILTADKSHPLHIFRPFCTWHKSGQLDFFEKHINILGARDERALGKIQGKTMDLCYCNEMTLFPESVLNMIPSRLSMAHSKLYADMNPSHPEHKCKKMIDLAREGNEGYYELMFKIEDNLKFLSQDFIDNQKKLMSGLFFRRFYLGEWCLAEGAIFDFFERDIHVDKRMKPCDFWIAGIDYGASNAFACVIIGIKQKKFANDTAYAQVQAEYYYNGKGMRTKTNSEYANDLEKLFLKYPVRSCYLDPSAASFKAELQKKGIPVRDTDNDVLSGITLMTDLVASGEVSIHESCSNLIREIQGYCWDDKAAKRGEDKPLKINDHTCVTGDTWISIDVEGGNRPIGYLERHFYEGACINYNPNTGELESDTILRVALTRKLADVCRLELEGGNKLWATGDHQILTKRGFVALNQLMLSDMVGICGLKNEINFVKVKSIKNIRGKRSVYCIGTKNNGTMIANGIITKNCDSLRYALKGFLQNRTTFSIENKNFGDDFGRSLGYRRG